MSFPNSEDTHHQHQQQATGVDNCDEVGWYILGENQQNLGPYAFSELREHFLNGYLSENSLLWSEEEVIGSRYLQFELITAISQPGVDCSSAGLIGNIMYRLCRAPINDEDEFEKWQKEVREAEALKNSTSGSVGGDFGDEDNERPSTPPDVGRVLEPGSSVTSWTRALVIVCIKALGGEDATLLEASFFEDEVFCALSNLSEDNAPGPDETKHDAKRKLPEKQAEKKEPSVALAIQILDGTPLRQWARFLCQWLAKFEQKGEKFVAKQIDKRKKKKLKRVEEILGWGRGHDAKLSIPATVVLLGDVQEECIKLGSVDLVKVCESHPQGVVLVKYKDRRDAQKFGGRQIHASEDDGSVNHALVRIWTQMLNGWRHLAQSLKMSLNL
ncbi:hypothetical protein AAG906_010225 [Vitis piasezkii]